MTNHDTCPACGHIPGVHDYSEGGLWRLGCAVCECGSSRATVRTQISIRKLDSILGATPAPPRLRPLVRKWRETDRIGDIHPDTNYPWLCFFYKGVSRVSMSFRVWNDAIDFALTLSR